MSPTMCCLTVSSVFCDSTAAVFVTGLLRGGVAAGDACERGDAFADGVAEGLYMGKTFD